MVFLSPPYLSSACSDCLQALPVGSAGEHPGNTLQSSLVQLDTGRTQPGHTQQEVCTSHKDSVGLQVRTATAGLSVDSSVGGRCWGEV